MDSIGVCTNIQAGGNTSYCLTCRGTYGTGECNVVKAVNGSQSTLCTGVLYALTPTNGMLYSLQSVGTSTVVLTPTINGTAVPGLASTCTDSSSPLTGGQPGVTVGVGPTSSTANTYLYGFSGGVPPVSATHRSFGMVF